ncbi:MAG: hypothetical protein GY790_07780, partial [Bacteroidetes bacterium]|nr:hypothetical protein [Bacteroidota bacterium]
PYLLPPVESEANLQSDGKVLLRWKDISEGELGFVIQSTGADGRFRTVDTVTTGVTKYIHSPSKPNTKLQYRIFAFDDERTSITSQPVSVE